MKHLQADLKNLFKPILPAYTVQSLPKGSVYVPRMTLQAIEYYSSYSYDTDFDIIRKLEPFTSTKFLSFCYPKKRTLHHRFSSIWIAHVFGVSHSDNSYTKLFRTEAYAYIDMFINYEETITKYPDKYKEIYSKYPEYFI